MAELTIDPASIRKALDDFVSSYKPSDTPTQEVGYVATAGDGIAPVSYTHLTLPTICSV